MRRSGRRRVPRALTAAVAAAAVLAAGALVVAPARAATSQPTTAPTDTDAVQRVIITTTGATPTAGTLDRQLAAADVTKVRRLAPGVAVVTLRHPVAGSALRSVRTKLAALPSVGAAVPDQRIVALGTPAPVTSTDTRFGGQWDLWDSRSTVRAGGYGIDAPRAWKRSSGSSAVTVAVLDTGITLHPDLAAAHITAGYDFVTNDQADGIYSLDGDDWDTDPTDPGDYCSDDGESLADADWHGTFVTGEIAAARNGGLVAGVAPGVQIEPVRVLGGCGGSESDEIAAIRWAAGLPVTETATDGSTTTLTPPSRAQVISMSLGADAPCDTPLQDTITAAIDAGSVVVAAAGNDGGPVAASAPADCAGVIRVAASTRAGGLAYYSNYGVTATPVTIAAPGGDDVAGIVGDSWTVTDSATGATTPGVEELEGTSMATPRVAAAVGLLLSIAPQTSPTGAALAPWVAARLTSSAVPFPKSAGCTATLCGAGILNVGNLLGAKGRFVNIGRPRITGTARVGMVLHATGASWRPAATKVAYIWLRGGAVITGATKSTYRATRADRGERLSVRVVATRSGYDTAWRTSATVPVRG